MSISIVSCHKSVIPPALSTAGVPSKWENFNFLARSWTPLLDDFVSDKNKKPGWCYLHIRFNSRIVVSILAPRQFHTTPLWVPSRFLNFPLLVFKWLEHLPLLSKKLSRRFRGLTWSPLCPREPVMVLCHSASLMPLLLFAYLGCSFGFVGGWLVERTLICLVGFDPSQASPNSLKLGQSLLLFENIWSGPPIVETKSLVPLLFFIPWPPLFCRLRSLSSTSFSILKDLWGISKPGGTLGSFFFFMLQGKWRYVL